MQFKTHEALGIYYINGLLSAEIISRGKITATWENPFPIIEEDELEKMLLTIPEQINYTGYYVSMIIAAPPIEHHILPVPAMKRKDLVKFCSWKTEALKGKGYVWSYTKLKSIHHKGSICLHIIPPMYRSLFITFCQKCKLEPQHLLTVPAVVSGLLEKNDDSDGTVEMMALVTDRITYFVIGTKNAPLFIREIPFTSQSTDASELAQFSREIKRTALFIKNQFDREIGILTIRGSNTDTLSGLSLESGITTLQIEETPIHLFESVNSSGIYRTDNLLPFDMLGSRARFTRTIIFIAIILCFLGVLIGAKLYIRSIMKSSELTIQRCNIVDDLSKMRDTLDFFATLKGQLQATHQTHLFISTQSKEHIVGYFIGYCADILPEQLSVSRLAIFPATTSGGYAIEIEGICPPDPLQSASLLAQFEQTLSSEPANIKIIDSWHTQWLTNLHNGGGKESDRFSRRFRITGVLQ